MLSAPSAIAASALGAASVGLSVSAKNVANLATAGFSPSTASMVESPGGGVAALVEDPQVAASADRTTIALSSSAPSRTDPVAETVSQIQLGAYARANLATLLVDQDLSGALFRIHA